jgi:hypothetical protein
VDCGTSGRCTNTGFASKEMIVANFEAELLKIWLFTCKLTVYTSAKPDRTLTEEACP